MRDIARTGAQGLLAGTLLLMLYYAPRPVMRELQFVASILIITALTRSMTSDAGLRALAHGLSTVVILVVGAGYVMTSANLDMSSGITNWGLIPILEEAVKLLPVAFAIFLYRRRSRLSPNPSDLLMLGCAAGAGFALSENVALIQGNAGAARDMARQYGPHIGGFYLVPGAWGVAGYVGHAAATGFIAGGYGLGLALRDRLGPRWWIVPALAAAWIVIEHMFVNLYVNAGSSVALLLGNGALTPWLFVAMAAAIVALDVMRHYATIRQSRTLTWRLKLTKAALLRRTPPLPRSRVTAAWMYLAQVRLVNAAGWYAQVHPPRAVAGPERPRHTLETT